MALVHDGPFLHSSPVEPETHFARLGEQRIAYKVLGEGAVDLIGSCGSFSSMDGTWAIPEATLPFERLATHCRLILFDRLGTGSSDPVPIDALPPLESRWAEIEAVMDAVGTERAVMFGMQDGGPPVMYGAASSPGRVSGLVLFHSPARFRWGPDYPIGMDDSSYADWRSMMDHWDTDRMLQISFPSRAGDERFLVWGRRYMRALAGPSALLAYMNEMVATDVRSLLSLIAVPTLVLHRRDYQWTQAELDRYVADHIDGSRFVEVPGADASLYFGDSEPMIDAIATFLREIEPAIGAQAPPERMMATVLFTDIVSSTQKASASGDSEWVRTLRLHDEIAAEVVGRHLGRVVKNTGDGILALFDGPGRGLVASIDLRAALDRIGLPIRAGLHTGEVELRGEDVAGIGVHIAARVMGEAGPGEILASRTVRDLVFGSQFRFVDRGLHHLKGVDGSWELLALAGA